MLAVEYAYGFLTLIAYYRVEIVNKNIVYMGKDSTEAEVVKLYLIRAVTELVEIVTELMLDWFVVVVVNWDGMEFVTKFEMEAVYALIEGVAESVEEVVIGFEVVKEGVMVTVKVEN